MYSHLEVLKLMRKLAVKQLDVARADGHPAWIAYQEQLFMEADEMVRQEEGGTFCCSEHDGPHIHGCSKRREAGQTHKGSCRVEVSQRSMAG